MFESISYSCVRRSAIAIVLTSSFVGTPATAAAAEPPAVEVSPPVTPYVIDVDLRDLPAAPTWRIGDPVREIPIRRYSPNGLVPVTGEPLPQDPLVQRQRDHEQNATRDHGGFTTLLRNVPGMGFTGVTPPDTVGDVGPNHYIQSINTGGGADVRIWDKAIPPNVITTFRMDILGTGACANGFGDPIVIYDRQADRWMLTEFAGTGSHLCVYISQTPDPITGGWYAYDFATASFPDYPKYAVWATDANGGDGSYIVTANDGGPGAYALNRGEMLIGGATQFIRIGMPALPGFLIQGPTPADPDGPNGPPSGAPAIIMRHRDTELHGGAAAVGDILEMWFFDVDWVTTSNSSLTLVDNVDVADFDSRTCGTSFSGCFAQPGTSTTLFPLREVIMNRLQYYRHDQFESLVGNFVVDVGGDQGGVRWFDLRRDTPAEPWTTYQEGTYSIDSDNRWMAAIAMDQSENIAVAYSVSSSTTFPSLRYTGRLQSDPLGLMTQPETSIHDGSAANSSSRWGDYAATGLDPTDDCTFWFTSMDNSSSNWRTQVASMKFDLCGCLTIPTPPTIQIQAVAVNAIDLNWGDSDLDTAVGYSIKRSRTSGGPYDTVAVIPDNSPGLTSGSGYSYTDSEVDGGVTYYYVVLATDGETCESLAQNEVNATAFGSCGLRPIFDGLQSATGAIDGTCANQLDWSPALPECDGPIAYNVYRSTTAGFTPAAQDLVVGGQLSSSAIDVNGLIGGQEYHYIVRAVDLSNGAEELNDVEFSALAAGPLSGFYTSQFVNFSASTSLDDWTVTLGPGVHRCGEWALATTGSRRPAGGSGQYVLANSLDCAAVQVFTSASIDSPTIDLDVEGLVAATVEVNLYFNHDGGEDGTIEVWDGSQWVVIWSDPDADVNQQLTLDVTPYANAAFQVRFNYQNANENRWFSFDNFTLTTELFLPCLTSATPASAGDGQSASAQLTADKSGTDLAVVFDASCGATDYNLIYGDLNNVAAAAIDGDQCSIGTSGSYSWSGVPAGDLYFLVVGADTLGTESSWGEGTYGERNGLVPSGRCGVTVKEISNICD